MRKILTYIVCTLAITPLLQGCFKDVVNYTQYRAAVYEQTASDGEFTPATTIESYAFYVDTTEWRVASYEDAVARRLTNKITGQSRTEPDAVGEFNAAEEYQVSIKLEAETSMIVFVNPALKLYAYRKYTLPVNLPSVLTKLYMASWRDSHSTSGWRIVNEFYAPPVEEDTPPTEDEDIPTEDEGDEDTPTEDTPPTDEDDNNTETEE